jgi:GTPase
LKREILSIRYYLDAYIFTDTIYLNTQLKLVNPSPERVEHLISQMKWRLAEGMGEAIYEIGVEDDGNPTGLSEPELKASLETLEQMAKQLNADISGRVVPTKVN